MFLAKTLNLSALLVYRQQSGRISLDEGSSQCPCVTSGFDIVAEKECTPGPALGNVIGQRPGRPV
jgi:hypothetical protein